MTYFHLEMWTSKDRGHELGHSNYVSFDLLSLSPPTSFHILFFLHVKAASSCVDQAKRKKRGVFIQFSLNCACLKCFSKGSAVNAVVAFFSSAAQGDFLFSFFFIYIYNSKCL